MKALVLILLTCLSISLATANQNDNAQKLQLQKRFLSAINQCSNPRSEEHTSELQSH